MPYTTPILFVDGDHTVASAVSLPVFESPLPFTTEAVVFNQDFEQHIHHWEALPLNTPHPLYPDFFLVREGPRQDLYGGFVRWTRTYAKPPESYDLFVTFSYRFVGWSGFSYALIGSEVAIDPEVPYGREPFTKVVMSRIRHDFFLVDDTTPNPVDNVLYPTPGDIPTYLALRYLFADPNIIADYLTDAPPYVVASIPSRTQYTTMSNNALRLKWASDVVIFDIDPSTYVPSITVTANSGQIPVEDSAIEPWLGKIWLRTTRYVLAQ